MLCLAETLRLTTNVGWKTIEVDGRGVVETQHFICDTDERTYRWREGATCGSAV